MKIKWTMVTCGEGPVVGEGPDRIGDKWQGDMPTLFIIMERRPRNWDLVLHDVELEGWRMSLAPAEPSHHLTAQKQALEWAKELVAKWHKELEETTS